MFSQKYYVSFFIWVFFIFNYSDYILEVSLLLFVV